LKQSAREIYNVKRVASVPLTFAGIVLIARASGRAVARSPKWHAIGAAMIEFGVEDTDLRLVRLEYSCGLLEMIGPIPQIESDLFQCDGRSELAQASEHFLLVAVGYPVILSPDVLSILPDRLAVCLSIAASEPARVFGRTL
jgi:hypothetical protein